MSQAPSRSGASGNGARFRRVVGGISLIGAPVAFLIGTAIHPGLRADGADQLDQLARHPDAWYATHILGLIFVTL